MSNLKKKKLSHLENQLITSIYETKSSDSVIEHSDSIPIDILINIFSRVPAKSVARFRCLSKFWAYIFTRSNFTELFLTHSSNWPRILFLIESDDEELFFFSSPQPQNPNKDCSLVATRYKQLPKHVTDERYNLQCGLLFHQRWNGKAQMICNPINGKRITLPTMRVKGMISGRSFLCYDPTNKQLKVLCTILSSHVPLRSNTHHVLTLKTGNFCWRTIEHKPYFSTESINSEICINGVLYYGANDPLCSIVCFDVSSEKFSYIDISVYNMFEGIYPWTLTNYKGKLGAHHAIRNGFDNELVVWVLEDVVNNKWSKNVCVLTPLWNKVVDKDIVYNVRVTCGGEIVFSPWSLSNPFYIFYYSSESNTFTRLEIQGFNEFVDGRIRITSVDFIENMKKLM